MSSFNFSFHFVILCWQTTHIVVVVHVIDVFSNFLRKIASFALMTALSPLGSLFPLIMQSKIYFPQLIVRFLITGLLTW